MKNSNLTIGERLKDLRIKKGAKLKDVERDTRISASSLRNYENAETPAGIGLVNFLALARYYDVSIPFLLGETETRKNEDFDIMKGLSEKFITFARANRVLHEYSIVDYDVIDILNSLFSNPIAADDIFCSIS